MGWELQTAWTVDVFTLSCTEIVKSSIMQVSREQILTNIEKHAQQGKICSKHELLLP